MVGITRSKILFYSRERLDEGSSSSGRLFHSLRFHTYTSHLHIFPLLHIFTSSQLRTYTSHLHIFASSHPLFFTSTHTIFSSSHPLFFTSTHIIFSSSYLFIFTSSHLHSFTSSQLHIFPLSLSLPLLLLSLSPASFIFCLQDGRGANEAP